MPSAPRLYCFPYAGGIAQAYAGWASALPGIDVCAIELPGHGMRMSKDACIAKMDALATELSDALERHIDQPFAFFGHSMGALLAFLCACRLRQRGVRSPLHLFVSARVPPHKDNPDRGCSTLSDAALTENLRRRGGTPRAILEEPEIMARLLPIVRADFAVLDSYAYSPEVPLSCPVSAYGGRGDERARESDLAEWATHTTGQFSLAMFEGGHFFIDTGRALVLEKVSSVFRSAVPR
jgi:medium-chain acyl-[acyl-carrier-protein] hydrolase